MSERLAQGPCVAARVGFESATLRTQGTKPYHWATMPHIWLDIVIEKSILLNYVPFSLAYLELWPLLFEVH